MNSIFGYLGKQSPLMLAGAGVLILGALYYFGKKAVTDVAAGAAKVGGAAAETIAGIATGNNAITENATNSQGVPVSAYEGAGILGTAGATVNAALGGVPASIGESIGGWVFDLLHSDG